LPTYSYRCTECANAFDIQQAFTDDTLTVCPACNGSLRKVFSPVGVSFTGSGFYRTDSRAKPASDAGTSAAKPAAKESAPAKTPAPAASTPTFKSSTN
jgi:putative FmdB family regulatory protein